MQSLLRWSIENSSPQNGTHSNNANATQKDLDPGIIDAILGRPDAELMKEDLTMALDSSKSEDARVDALDHLEMLIEQIDNANDLKKLNMWEPLHSLLTSETSPLSVKIQALWVIGTALQNNPSAQDAYLAHNPLPTLVSFLVPSSASTLQSRSKAIYTLSGLLKHNAPAVKELGSSDVDGWARLRDSLQDPEITVRRKTLFLLNTLLLPTMSAMPTSTTPSNLHAPTSPPSEGQQTPIHPNSHAAHLHDPSRASTSQLTLDAFKEHGITGAVVDALTNPLPCGEDGEIEGGDVKVEEHGARLLHTYVVICSEKLSGSEKDELKSWLEQGKEKEKGDEKVLAERLGMDASELNSLIEKVV